MMSLLHYTKKNTTHVALTKHVEMCYSVYS